MRILILASSIDPAGSNLFRALDPEPLERIGNHEVTFRLIDELIIRTEPPAGFDLIVFLSKHAARSANDAMCVHAIGNFSTAELGGRDRALVPTHPAMLTALYQTLSEAEPETNIGTYEVSLEAVHHGPYTDTPSIFYELGASEENWNDTQAASLMAKVLRDVLASDPQPRPSFFGLGSNHYCAGFDALVDRYDFAGSCAKHSLTGLNENHLRWIDERYDRIVLDWNTLGREKRRILSMLEKLEISYDRRKRLRKES